MAENSMGTDEFLPRNESARLAVERARKIVRENDEMVALLKLKSQIEEKDPTYEDVFTKAEQEKFHDAHAFELYKIRSNSTVKDFFKGIFGVH